MGLTPDELEDLLVGAAVGALDPADTDRFTALKLTEGQARRYHDLEGALIALHQPQQDPPPPFVREAVLAAASRQGPPLAEPNDVVEVLAHQVRALADLLGQLNTADWAAPAHPYRWNVHGLVAHLAVTEEYLAGQLGFIEQPHEEAAHLDVGAGDMAGELSGPPEHTARRWQDRAQATVARLQQQHEVPAQITLNGWPFPLDAAIIVRAFEVWTHIDDLRRATGRALSTPEPGDLRTISSMSVRALPLLAAIAFPAMTVRPTRVVLTGPGGGTYDIGSGGGSPPAGAPVGASLVVADVVDYCRMAARRLPLTELDCAVEGDEAAIRALLASAAVLSV